MSTLCTNSQCDLILSQSCGVYTGESDLNVVNFAYFPQRTYQEGNFAPTSPSARVSSRTKFGGGGGEGGGD